MQGSHPDTDKQDFTNLVEKLGALLHSHNMLFTAAMSPAPEKADGAYEMTKIIEHFDYLNVMTYDYHGWFPEHNYTGHNAPLYR